MSRVILFWFCLISLGGYAQQLPNNYLLQDLDVQLECTDAINQMYNFKFDSAAIQFNQLKKKFPQHPLPYFLFGLMEYWKYLPNTENKQYDEPFLAYMDTAIDKAQVMYGKNNNNIEANFFLSAAYGFKGRLLSDRKHWRKATVAAKNAMNHMQLSKNNNELSPEFMFGDALYNYYSVWIPENYPILKPIMIMFPKGEKGKGIEQLREVAYNAFYTRTEAQSFLMNIYFNEEDNSTLAFPIAQQLYQSFPNNPYFARMYARIAYQIGRTDVSETISLDILKKIDNKTPFYEEVSGRYAAFFLGYLYRFRKNDLAKAKEYFLKAVSYSEKINATNVGYYLWSLSYLAQMADVEKNIDGAKKYYQKIKNSADKDHPTYKEAKKYLSSH